MYLEWPENPETGIAPCLEIGYNTMDYFLSAEDGLKYPREYEHGSPSITIRGSSWWGHFNRIDEGIAVHMALNSLSDEEIMGATCWWINTILSNVTTNTVMYDEHGLEGNSVSFLNRAKDGGIGVRFYSPYSTEQNWHNKIIDPERIQEANLLVKPIGSGLEGVRTGSESVVFATVAQMHAIMQLTQALEKAGSIGNNKTS